MLLTIISFVIFVTGWATESDEPIMTLSGVDGPTAIFVSTRADPTLIIIPLVIIVILLMNILVIKKQKQ